MRRVDGDLVDRAGSHHTRIQFDFAKCALVPGDILLQDRRQGFRLLRAQIDALKIVDLHLGLALLLQGTEYQKEIPDIHSHLHAVGIVLTIFGRIDELDIGLRWVRHSSQCNGVAVGKQNWVSMASSSGVATVQELKLDAKGAKDAKELRDDWLVRAQAQKNYPADRMFAIARLQFDLGTPYQVNCPPSAVDR